MGELLYDIRYSLRMFWENRIVSVVALLSIALGIGVTSAIFSVTDALLLRPLPYANPERVVMVWESRPQQGVTENVVAAADFKDWKEQNQAFEQLAAVRGESFTLTDVNVPAQIYGASVSANFFTLLGVKPALGRMFSAEEEMPGNNHVAMLSYELWQKQFGSDQGIINRTIRLDDLSYTVVGVLPPEFEFQDRLLQVWAPLSLSAEEWANRGMHSLMVVGQLKPGADLSQARAEMDGIALRLAQAYPDKNEGHGVNLVPIREQILGKTMKTALLVLQVAVGFVLLIACANVANLQLSVAVKRRKESAIRTALGASRLRLVRQFLTESVVLSVLGGLLGLLLAFASVKLIATLIPQFTSGTIYGWDQIRIDGRVVGFTFLVAVLTGIIFGTIPALRASEVKLSDELKEGTRGTTSGGRGRLRNLLVVTEVALAIVLLIGAGVMLKSFWRLRVVNPGFNPQNVLTMSVPISTTRYPTAPQRVDALKQIAERVGSTSGVESVGAVFSLPLGGQRASRTYTVEGQAPQSSSQDSRASYNAISPNYLRTMGITLLKGRDFNEQDLATPSSVIVNATMANRLWPNEDPIGRRIKIGGAQSTNPWLSVVGIVADATQTGLDAAVRPEIYVPLTQSPVPTVFLVTRVASSPAAAAPAIRQAILEVDRNQPVGNVRPMEQVLADSVAQPRLYAVLLGSFATVALVLAVIGIYSMMAYSVTQRTQEIGMRMALGAAPRDILTLILKQGLLLTLIGGGIGLLGAYAATSVMSSLLFGITPKDPLTFVQVTVILVVVSLVASYIPARRAKRLDPMLALRNE